MPLEESTSLTSFHAIIPFLSTALLLLQLASSSNAQKQLVDDGKRRSWVAATTTTTAQAAFWRCDDTHESSSWVRYDHLSSFVWIKQEGVWLPRGEPEQPPRVWCCVTNRCGIFRHCLFRGGDKWRTWRRRGWKTRSNCNKTDDQKQRKKWHSSSSTCWLLSMYMYVCFNYRQ